MGRAVYMATTSALAVVAIILGAPCLCGAATSEPATQETPSPTILEGMQTHTAAGGGTWRAFFNASGARLVEANKDALWFPKGPHAWRYCIKTRMIDAQTSVWTHPDLNMLTDLGNTSLAPDGRFAISSQLATYLWTPGKGWSRLPQPMGDPNAQFVAFDSAGQLWATSYTKAYAWNHGAWADSLAVPQHTALVPVGDGWLMWNNFGQGKEWPTFTWMPRDFDVARHLNYGGRDPGNWLKQSFRVGDATVAVVGGSLVRAQTDHFEVLVTGAKAVLDVGTGETFTYVDAAGSAKISIQTPDGKAVDEIPTPPAVDQYDRLLLRDPNGHYWIGRFRWDGRSWQAIQPENAFDYAGDTREAVISGRLKFDETKQTWVDTWNGVPADVAAYNPKTRTGWLKRDPKEFKKPVAWDQFEFPADGSRKSLRSVTVQQNVSWPTPTFEDPAENLWFGSDRRWDGQGFHAYDNGTNNQPLNLSEDRGIPRLFLSPKGNVWMYCHNRTWRRFDPTGDRFVEGEPYDDYAFTAGGRTFAVVDREWNGNGTYKHSYPGMLYEKTGDVWQAVLNPFVGKENIVRSGYYTGYCAFYGLSGKAAKDSRLLLATYMGVFEYDAASDRWAYVTSFPGQMAYFDDAGRHVMVSSATVGRILMYEGDPFAGPPAEAAGDLREQIDQLLKDMDNDRWKVRSQAQIEMINLARKHPALVTSYLTQRRANGNLSPEVKARIQLVLDDQAPPSPPEARSHESRQLLWRSKVGNSLFERTCQRLMPTFPGGYVITPGMRYEVAKAVFAAAGAKYSADVHNKHYPDLTYQGYLLPGFTMVYMRVEGKDATGKIVSIGVGLAGQGCDPNWPWNDPSQNSLPKLELKPVNATIGD